MNLLISFFMTCMHMITHERNVVIEHFGLNGFILFICYTESCHDFLDDCDILIAEDSSFCQFNKEAHRICRQSCGFCSKEAATPGMSASLNQRKVPLDTSMFFY